MLRLFLLSFGTLFCLFACSKPPTYTKTVIPKENYGSLLETPSTQKDKHPSSPINWQSPSTWTSIPLSTFNKAKFQISEDTQLSVSSFPGSAGGLLSNINRWRQQLALLPIKITQLADYCETFKSDFTTFTMVSLVSQHDNEDERRAIFAAIFVYKNDTWFVKCMGLKRDVDANKQRIYDFITTFNVDD
ncbi:MAG: hypothetical protein VW378_01575 [bacterium]